MKMIDIFDWEYFCVGDLFDIHPTKAYKLTNKDLIVPDGTIPVIVNSSYNNGVGGYSLLKPTEEGNMITFSDTTSFETIFYQEFPFIGYPHVQGLYALPKYKNKWNKYSLLFFATALRKAAFTMNVNYVNKFTREIAKNLIVKLPIDINKEPNWLFMEDYIKQTIKKQIENISRLQKTTSKNKCFKYKQRRFHLYDLFDIDMGNKLDRVKMKTDNPEVNFVGRSNENQGVTAKVNRINNIPPYKKGSLTLALGGAYLGSCFIQENDFYTSQNVIVLIPKKEMPFEVKLFISSVIFRESQLGYKAFIDELNRHIKTDFTIPLPVKEDETLDYSFMKKHIENIIKLQKEKIQTICSIY